MPWIKELDQPDLPEIFRVLSLNSHGLDNIRHLNEGLAFGNSTLSRVQEEAISTVVSVANHCRYGALTHGAFLRRYSADSGLASQTLGDYSKADWSARDRLMLDFAARITLEPAKLTESEVHGLRAASFEDKDIVSKVLVTRLVNFMNRIASSLGVQVHRSFQRAMQRWVNSPANEQSWLFGSKNEESQPQSDGSQSTLTLAEQTHLAETSSPVDSPGGAYSANGDELIAGDEDETSGDDDASPFILEGSQSLQRFVDECCTISPDGSSTAKDLYIAYIRWCDENRLGPLTQQDFGFKLADFGFRSQRRGQCRYWWLGVGLKERASIDA